MRKILYILLLLFIATPLFGQSTVIVAKKKAAATCSVDTNEVGRRDEDESTAAGTNAYMYCTLFTPDCSGKLYTAYLRHAATDTENAKLCVYLDDGDSAPDAGDSVVVCSGAISSGGSSGWKNAAMATNPSVSTANNYWVCIVNGDSTAWNMYYTASGSRRSRECTGCYDSPPSNLDGTWGNSTATTDAYVTIGD
jgi:hypothetical protein